MRRFLFAGALVSVGAALPGCPIYASQDCFDTSDCPHNYVCDDRRGQCIASSSGSPATDTGARSCTVPSQCRAGETCGVQGVCSVGDCAQWGCVTGFQCEPSGASSKPWACLPNASVGAGSGGAAGRGGSASGGQGQGGDNLGGAGGDSRGGAAGAPATGTMYETNGLPAASGTLAVNNNQWQLPLGGMSSHPSSNPATLSLAGGDANKGEFWTLTISGQPDATTKTINCNAATSDPHALCRLFIKRMEGGAPATYVDSGTPFLIVWSSWGDGNFRAVAANVGTIRTAGGDGAQTTYSFDSMSFDFVRQTAP